MAEVRTSASALEVAITHALTVVGMGDFEMFLGARWNVDVVCVYIDESYGLSGPWPDFSRAACGTVLCLHWISRSDFTTVEDI